MRTPLDAFHQALVNLVDERRRAEEKARRRRRTGLTEATMVEGTRVTLRMPANLAKERAWADMVKYDRTPGTIVEVRLQSSSSPIVEVLMDADKTPGAWSIPALYLDLEDPPPSGNNIEEIERWLAS